jgi:hypothetical protein
MRPSFVILALAVVCACPGCSQNASKSELSAQQSEIDALKKEIEGLKRTQAQAPLPAAANAGRYQMHSHNSHVFILDSVTGNVWEKLVSSIQFSNRDEFFFVQEVSDGEAKKKGK